jgi:hypothetical protein
LFVASIAITRFLSKLNFRSYIFEINYNFIIFFCHACAIFHASILIH